MGFNSNGQIQYLILDSLSNGSKYGLEIIDYVSHKTGGNYIMKKPTLYSCLTRMEKKGLVSSSYWGDSEFGGKRHYYTITQQGRKNLEELAPEFEELSFDNDETKLVSNQTIEKKSEEKPEEKPVFLQQDNLFNMVKNEEEQKKPSISTELKDEKNDNIVENQIDFFSYEPQTQFNNNDMFDKSQNIENENEMKKIELDEQEKIDYYQSILEQDLYSHSTNNIKTSYSDLNNEKDDAKFLENQEKTELSFYQQEQNKRLYDTSNELKKYRKKKSFAENQIEMSVVYEKEEDAEIQKSRIEQLKQSMLNARQNSYENLNTEKKDPYKMDAHENVEDDSNIKTESNLDFEEDKDDAIFITNPPIQENEIPIQKKITPPNIEVNIYDDNLPAPKRDTNLEPTYKDMMAKLFERKKEKTNNSFNQPSEQPINQNIDSFADFDNLKKYYASHGIEFKEYKKTSVERQHNTNFLVFLSSVVLLLLSGVSCGIVFGIVSGLNLIKTESIFLYYTVPVLFCLYSFISFIRFKVYPSKKANLIYNSLINWTVFILAAIIIFVVNIACGMQFETVNLFLTSIIIPTIAVFIAFPVNYYIKKFLYKKYSK